MKFLYDLPETVRRRLETAGFPETPLYTLPAVLEGDGEGWCVVTTTALHVADPDLIHRTVRHADLEEVKARKGTGAGWLEARVAGSWILLARYTAAHFARYATVAREMERLRAGETARAKSTPDEDRCARCGRPYPPGTRVCPSCVSRLATIGRLAGVLRPYLRTLLLTLAIFGAVSALTLATPALTRRLIDGYLVPRIPDPGAILLLVAGMGASGLGLHALSIARGRIGARLSGSVSRDLRALVYTKLQALSLRYLGLYKPGDLMNRVASDTDVIQHFLREVVINGVSELVILVVIAVVLFAADPVLALLAIVPSAAVAIFAAWMWKRVRGVYRTQRASFDRVNSLLQDILSGIRVVKAFGRESAEVDRFRDASRELRDLTRRTEVVWSNLMPAFGLVLWVGTFLVLLYGGGRVLAGRMEAGELIQFTLYAGRLLGPLAWLAGLPRTMAQAATAAERIFGVIDREPDVRETRQPRRRTLEGSITLDDVSFGYRSWEPVIENVSIEIRGGEMIGLVGHSGAGKSTLVNLLLRLYDVDEGAIRMDGVDIREIALADLRGQVGVVLQEPFLFSGSVLENIRYARPDASLPDVIRAAKTANAHDFIVSFPDGYDTIVGERGQNLSGGERQRISIARAILHDPRILLLDEATSSLDTETEQKIQDALGRLVKGRTTIAIAHRLATLRNAHRLLVLDHGKVAELGSHDELMARKGIYCRLITTQRRMSGARGV